MAEGMPKPVEPRMALQDFNLEQDTFANLAVMDHASLMNEMESWQVLGGRKFLHRLSEVRREMGIRMDDMDRLEETMRSVLHAAGDAASSSPVAYDTTTPMVAAR